VIRVNQVGYDPSAGKLAYALTRRSVASLRFAVVDDHGRVVLRRRTTGSCGRWNERWQGCQVLDLGALRSPGDYQIRIGATLSPPFRIASGAALYGPLTEGAVAFMQAQRDGADIIPGALHRQPAHTNDATARIYAIPRYRNGRLARPLRATVTSVDLAGGWFDAGDYLKFSGTAAFTDALLLFTLREYGSRLRDSAAIAAEARFGTDWLLKTWNSQHKVLYEQVGLGDGDSSVVGDHDIWRLPQRDDHFRARSLRYIAHRPVFAANAPGAPVSPNLAGREAAAFGLCAQVFDSSDAAYAHRCLLAGQTLYDAAATRWRGPLAASVPASYYSHSESEWYDDMQLGATELYLAAHHASSTSGLPHPNPGYYLRLAAKWANAYEGSSSADADSLDLYDVSGLADYDLYRAMVGAGAVTGLATSAAAVRNDLRDQLDLAVQIQRSGPLGLSDPATPDDTVAHAFGHAIEARLFRALGGGTRFERMAEQQFDWVLGANPWGTSFVVGAGSHFPHCLSDQIANLSGSLTGVPPVLVGAVVDGPTGAGQIGSLSAPGGYRRCAADSSLLRSFDGHGFAYLDDVRSYRTSEPSDDLAALSLLAFAQEAAELS
jgi:endoglucanase